MLIPLSPVVENVCVFKEGTSSPDPICAVEKLSDTLQSCEPFCTTDVDSSERLSASDISRTDVVGGAFTSVRIADSSEHADNEGKESVRSGDASEIKHPDVLCSSSRRSTCTSKSNQKTETKKATRKCRKTADKKQSLELIFLKVARKRRSCFCKPARPSGWGLLGNISQFFQQNTGPDVNQNSRKKSQKSSGWGGGKRKKIQTPKNFKRSNGERSASTSHIRLKVKLGKELGQSCLMEIVPVIDNDLEKHWGTRRESPKINTDIGGKLEDELLGIGVTVDKGCLDPGTSPDSEVINLTPEAQISGEVAEDLHDVLISSQDYVAQGDLTCLSLSTMGSNKGERRSTHNQAGKGDCNEDCRFSSPEIINSVVPFKKYGQGDKTGDGFYSSEASLLTTMTCSSEGFSIEPLASSTVMDFRVSTETLKVESGAQVDLSPSIAVLESPESQILLPCSLPKGKKLPKSSGSRGASKRRKDVIDSVTRRGNTCGLKGNKSMLVNKSEVKVKGDGGPVVCEVGCHLDPGNHTLDDCGETKHGFSSTAKEISNLEMVQSVVGDQCVPQRNAWVCCDDCFKWRRIAAVLADSIDETNSRWICKDNMDKDFADCSVPQEKSNAEINAELEISDCEEDASGSRLNCNKLGQIQSTVPQQSSWKLIRSNLFLHRSRKTQIIDEIMVCNCKAPADGRMGCGDGCLNRMLNIECVKGTCPCGELCSNQQFQKRKYAKLKCFQCGKKGHGLQLLENIPKGRFLIEYVGEVLDVHAYEARQREYASKGHKHFYFMTLNGSEVIDACVKGNLGRFVNHSCEPNCRTEKWMVNGEVCVGLFAIRDIKKGEELTFDYNYVRVFGAAAKKCVCGSSQCRGYIGGDPLNTDIIVQGDSDEEFPEPVMVYEDGGTNMDNIVSSTNSFDGAEIQLQAEEILIKNDDEFDNSGTDIGHLKITEEVQTPEILLEHKDETAAVGCIETTIDSEDFLKKSSSVASKLEFSSEMEGSVGVSPCSAQPIENPVQLDDGRSEITSFAQQELSIQRVDTYLTATPSKSSPETIDIKSKSKPEMEGDKRVVSKSHLRVKTSRLTSSVKKGKLKISAVNVNKSLDMEPKPQKSKKLVEGSSNGDFEAVQEKLNDLIDANGGISKRKDASRGYLKLLFLTAASGDSGNGEAIQSNRDLSMILGALLKTKSRTVLVDIINKNGLQMLHNIMKRYNREFNKIPILRKVLKVFEYLAMREILILEHIISGPPCPGVESFRESILALTEHTDKQVYQIARKFRDRWIPRQYRKKNCMRHREDGRVEFHRGSDCNNRFSSASHNNHVSDWTGVMPTEKAVECVKKPVIATTTPVYPTTSCSSTSGVTTNGMTPRKRKTRWDSDFPRYKEIRTSELPCLLDKSTIDGGRSEIMDDEDIPPGFSDPLNKAIALHHENSGPTKYPREVVIGHQQERFVSRLPVSFGIPLSVVNQFGTSSQAEDSVEGWVVAPGMPFHPFPPLPPYPRGEQDFHNPNAPSTSGASQPAMEIPCPNNRHNFQRARGSGNNNLGRRYFRQHKWANSRLPPPWVRKFMGVGTVETRLNGPYKSAEVSHGGQQQPQHQNYH